MSDLAVPLITLGTIAVVALLVLGIFALENLGRAGPGEAELEEREGDA